MDDMNMNNEPPVYDSGDMKPTDPIPTEGENDAGLTEELPMYEDTQTGDRGARRSSRSPQASCSSPVSVSAHSR